MKLNWQWKRMRRHSALWPALRRNVLPGMTSFTFPLVEMARQQFRVQEPSGTAKWLWPEGVVFAVNFISSFLFWQLQDKKKLTEKQQFRKLF
jgi:hypothetical protein